MARLPQAVLLVVMALILTLAGCRRAEQSAPTASAPAGAQWRGLLTFHPRLLAGARDCGGTLDTARRRGAAVTGPVLGDLLSSVREAYDAEMRSQIQTDQGKAAFARYANYKTSRSRPRAAGLRRFVETWRFEVVA
jgi:hypothetical protein